MWTTLARAVEELGFFGLYMSDHFLNTSGPARGGLEPMVALAHAATLTTRLRIGTLVSPLSMRHPAQLTRHAHTMNALAPGRFILGVGAGWQAREHEMFGFALGSYRDRIQRLREGVEIIRNLLDNHPSFTYVGSHFCLKNATLRQPEGSSLSSVELLIGGNSVSGILPIAAQFANTWNGVFLPPHAFRRRASLLDELTYDLGRAGVPIRKSVLCRLHFGFDEDSLAYDLAWTNKISSLRDMSFQEKTELLQTRTWGNRLICTSATIARELERYSVGGASEIILAWSYFDDIDRLGLLAHSVSKSPTIRLSHQI